MTVKRRYQKMLYKKMGLFLILFCSRLIFASNPIPNVDIEQKMKGNGIKPLSEWSEEQKKEAKDNVKRILAEQAQKKDEESQVEKLLQKKLPLKVKKFQDFSDLGVDSFHGEPKLPKDTQEKVVLQFQKNRVFLPKKQPLIFPCSIEVINIPVLKQSELKPWPAKEYIEPELPWRRVALGEDGHCGYHALKNVEILIKFLDQVWKFTEDNKSLSQLLSADIYLEFMKKNAPLINAQPGRRGKGLSWLGGGELEYLRTFFPKPEQDKILIVERVSSPGFEFHENILKYVQRLIQEPFGFLGFVWNSGLRNNVNEMGGIHWVGFVAAKYSDENYCTVKLYVMDSGAGTGKLYLNQVTKLLSLSSEEIDNMLLEQQIQHMQRDINSIGSSLRKTIPTVLDVWDILMINWKDYKKIPEPIQTQILFWFKNLWLKATDDEKRAIRLQMVDVKNRLNLVEGDLRELFE